MKHKEKMIDLIKELSYRHSLWNVFSDFIEICAITISNAVDFHLRIEREKRYMDIIKNYNKEEVALFKEMFNELVMELEENPTDVLGAIFMELELGNKWKGQFFTPMAVCKACGAITATNAKELIKEKGFITVQEPAAGGGGMIIGLALAMQDLGINYQQTLVVTAVDIDLKAVHMCYVQLSLLGIPAIVCHGNTLSVEVFSEWKTPMYIFGGWGYKKQKNEKKIMKLHLEENGQYSSCDMNHIA